MSEEKPGGTKWTKLLKQLKDDETEENEEDDDGGADDKTDVINEDLQSHNLQDK